MHQADEIRGICRKRGIAHRPTARRRAAGVNPQSLGSGHRHHPGPTTSTSAVSTAIRDDVRACLDAAGLCAGCRTGRRRSERGNLVAPDTRSIGNSSSTIEASVGEHAADPRRWTHTGERGRGDSHRPPACRRRRQRRRVGAGQKRHRENARFRGRGTRRVSPALSECCAVCYGCSAVVDGENACRLPACRTLHLQYKSRHIRLDSRRFPCRKWLRRSCRTRCSIVRPPSSNASPNGAARKSSSPRTKCPA